MQALNEEAVQDAVKVFKALADGTRYQIVRMLLDHRELGCAEFAEEFGLSGPAMSHHYRVLENAGLVKYRKEGSHVFLRLNEEQLEQHLPGFARAFGPRAKAAKPLKAAPRRGR